MRELCNDPFYETLKGYDRLEVDYCLMESDSAGRGFSAHKEAVLYAMHRLRERYPWITVDEDRAAAEEISPETLFYFPGPQRKDDARGSSPSHSDAAKGGKIPYWYAFTEPPHGTGRMVVNGRTLRKRYGREDFEIVNHALFPQGTDELEVYEWSAEWSDYFDAGKEWWGTLCCSIYDKKMRRYAVIMASSTD